MNYILMINGVKKFNSIEKFVFSLQVWCGISRFRPPIPGRIEYSTFWVL
jgi:hypothetical protein